MLAIAGVLLRLPGLRGAIFGGEGAVLWRQQSGLLSVRNRCCAVNEPLRLLNPSQAGLVDVYIETLLRWNQRMNLTSVTNREEVMARHVGDSLALLPIIDDTLSRHCAVNENNLRVVDVGSGAGLPGIILAIARPTWQVTLMESIQKKCDFLEDALQAVSLQNVRVVRARAEVVFLHKLFLIFADTRHVLAHEREDYQEKGQDVEFRESYTVAVARAVAEMRVLAELCLPFVCIGGIMVAAKGANPQEEIEKAKKAIETLGGSLLPVSTVASESPLGMRTAVVCLKRSPTPIKYPRRPGMPSKNPL